MADRATLWWTRLGFFLRTAAGSEKHRDLHKQRAVLPSGKVHSYHVDVFVMREADTELGHEIAPLKLWIGYIAETRKQPSRGVARRDCDMAVRTNCRRGTLAGKELLAMTIQTGRVFGKIGNVRKRSVALAKFLPVFRRNFMTRVASELLGDGVCLVRELCVINLWFRWNSRL